MFRFLSHDFWVPFSRLSYGAYLSHGMFMAFRVYNAARGQWGCAFDAILFYLAFLTFSFFFSFLTAMLVEFPCAQLWYEFGFNNDKKKSRSSTKSKKKREKQNSRVAVDSDSISEEFLGNGKAERKTSTETEDLEE